MLLTREQVQRADNIEQSQLRRIEMPNRKFYARCVRVNKLIDIRFGISEQ